jgi:SlyX protein
MVSLKFRAKWRIEVNPEDRLIAIETKIAHQEDLVESLNQTIYNQQKKIDQLEDLFSALVRRIKDSGGADRQPSSESERPPHY